MKTLWEEIADRIYGVDVEPEDPAYEEVVNNVVEGVCAWLDSGRVRAHLGHCEPYVEDLMNEARRDP